MNAQNTSHPSDTGQTTSRRNALRRVGKLGLAAAAMPVAFSAVAKRAYGQDLPETVVEILNYALTLEYLESEFYTQGLNAEGLIPSEARDLFEQIDIHETSHVDTLKSALGEAAVPKPNFDFTSGGQFDTFSNYQTFLLLSQGFEDLGVRAYKGQAPRLIEYDDILTTALRIHSVEARHAAAVRRLRGLDSWIPFNNTPDQNTAIQAVYLGETSDDYENQTRQAGVEMKNVVNPRRDLTRDTPVELITESFDEPLNMSYVLGVASLFIVQ